MSRNSSTRDHNKISDQEQSYLASERNAPSPDTDNSDAVKVTVYKTVGIFGDIPQPKEFETPTIVPRPSFLTKLKTLLLLET